MVNGIRNAVVSRLPGGSPLAIILYSVPKRNPASLHFRILK